MYGVDVDHADLQELVVAAGVLVAVVVERSAVFQGIAAPATALFHGL
jgi:hypothetical protein